MDSQWKWRLRLALIQRRNAVRRILRVVFGLAAVTFAAPLVYDLVRGFGGAESVAEFGAQSVSPYVTTLQISKLQIDTAAMTARGDAVTSIAASRDAPDIDMVLLSFTPEGSCPIYTTKDPKLAGSNGSIVAGATGERFPAGDIAGTLEARLTAVRKRTFYPFDRYTFDVALRGCVGGGLPCDANFLAARQISVNLAEQHFVIAGMAYDPAASHDSVVRLVLARPFFLQWVSGWVGVFLLASLFYLMRLSDSRDLVIKAAGYFGTMWAFRQLVTPPGFTVFPTAIDYYVLALFATLFFVVTYRIMQEQTEGKP